MLLTIFQERDSCMLNPSTRRFAALVLLACLLTQPIAVHAFFTLSPNNPSDLAIQANKSLKKDKASAEKPPEVVIPKDFQLSTVLHSPMKRDLAALEFLSQFSLSANQDFLHVMRNGTPTTLAALEKMFSKEEIQQKRTWMKLFNSLQFLNEEGKKSVVTGLGHTFTEAGRIAFLNLLAAQEDSSLSMKEKIKVARSRQEFIKFLVDNPKILKKIQQNLTVLKQFEMDALPLLIKKDPFEGLNDKLRKQIEKNQKLLERWMPVYWAFLANYFLALYHQGGNINPQTRVKAFLNDNTFDAFTKFVPNQDLTPTQMHMAITFGALFLPKLVSWLKEFEVTGNMLTIAKRTAGIAATATLASLTTTAFDPEFAAQSASFTLEGGAHIAMPFWNAAKIIVSTPNTLRDAFAGTSPSWTDFNPLKTSTHKNIHSFCDEIRTNQKAYADFMEKPLLDGSTSALTSMKRKYITSLLMAPLTYFAISKTLSSFVEQKSRFERANGVANILRATHGLRKLVSQTSDVRIFTEYEACLKYLSATYKTLEEKAVSSLKYSPTATYNPANWLIHNHARDDYFMNHTGETLEDFSRITQFYGEVDVYAALAQFMIDHKTITSDQGEKVECCFVEFMETPLESMVLAEEMWHPMIPTSQVCTNSINLGDCEENPRNAIITGPNAAGKSVSMKAMLVNLILGQAFGIACAKTFKFTPFKKIIARLTTNDDTANDQSKFIIEASEVVAFLKELKNLKPGEKAFVVTDELFSGTEVNPSIQLSLELCARISHFPNVCYLLATHYKDLTQLKEITGNLFENFKVTAFVLDNKVNYPFKLTKGVGDVNVAFDIFLDQMEKQGVSDEELTSIIANARNRHTQVGRA